MLEPLTLIVATVVLVLLIATMVRGLPSRGQLNIAVYLFRDGFVDTKRGEISEGWELGELVTFEYGRLLGGYRDTVGSVPVFGTNGPIGFTEAALCKHAGVIVGRKGAYRGVYFSSGPFWTIDTAFFVEAKKPVSYRWLFYVLLRADINSQDSGSAIPSTSRDDFYTIPAAIPRAAVMDAIDTVLASFWKRRECLERECVLLGRLRDALLPQLLAGAAEAGLASSIRPFQE